ncbi:MAG: carbohydrate ABC transporter permease [Candidatus Hodarchaeales archaeon]
MPKNKKVVKTIFVIIISLLITGFFFFPYLWIVLMSFKSRIDILSLEPKLFFKPVIDNYSSLFADTDFFHLLKNSTIIVSLTLLISFALGLPVAYALARFKFKRKEDTAFWVLSLRMAPPMAVVIPYFVIGSLLRVLDTIPALVVVYLTFNVPFVIWSMRSFYEEIPKEIEEAAKLDGLNNFQVFFRISTPLVLNGMAATAILCTILSWNEFAFALFLTGTKARPVSTMVTMFMTFQGVMWGKMAAATVIATIPIIIFTIAARNWLVRGLTFGAVK